MLSLVDQVSQFNLGAATPDLGEHGLDAWGSGQPCQLEENLTSSIEIMET